MMSEWSTLKDRVAGRWQLPLLVLSLALLGGGVLRLWPSPQRLTVDESLAHLDRLIVGGLYDKAIEFAGDLHEGETYGEAELASVELRLARARYRRSERDRAFSASQGRLITDHYQAATEGGVSLSPEDTLHFGRAFEWQSRYAKAVEQYNRAIEAGIPDGLDLRHHVLRLRYRHLDPSAERFDALLDGFLADLGSDRLDLKLWAIERKFQTLEELGRLEEASVLLAKHEEVFEASDFASRFAYLEGLFLHKRGYYDQAEAHLRTVRNQLERQDETHAMTGWLLGRVVARDGGPQRPFDAMSFFHDVITYHAGSEYAVASRIGMAESLAMLGRHDEAVTAYEIALEELADLGDSDLVSRAVVRASLGVMAEEQRLVGSLRAALGYARLAEGLTDPNDTERASVFLESLARAAVALAESLRGEASSSSGMEAASVAAIRKEAQARDAEAGEAYLRLARLHTFNEERSTEASWLAAEQFALAGQRDRSAQLFATFAKERPTNPLVPRALLREGQLRQKLGQLPEAIEAYRSCYRRFPRMLDGARTLVPLAECFLLQGPGQEELAEKTLHLVLDDSDVFTPWAPEFADALFMLGDVLNRRGAFERAITTLEEGLQRYPDDARVSRARFWLADSYRRSGLAMKRELSDARYGGERKRMRAESSERLDRAAALYREVIDDYELRDPADLSLLGKLYLRHAYLYQADCRFEMGRHRVALKLYDEAAGLFKDSVSVLAVFVQIINCHVFLGEPGEARTALARAAILADAIPESAFTGSASPQTRGSWKKYFAWLGESGLF